jgi:hypothetical protein
MVEPRIRIRASMGHDDSRVSDNFAQKQFGFLALDQGDCDPADSRLGDRNRISIPGLAQVRRVMVRPELAPLPDAQFRARTGHDLTGTIEEFGLGDGRVIILICKARCGSDRSQSRRLDEGRIQSRCDRRSFGWEAGHHGVAGRGVKHCGKHAALYGAVTVCKLRVGQKPQLYFSRPRINRNDLAPQEHCGRRHSLQMI